MVPRALSQALQRIEAALAGAPGLSPGDAWYVALLLAAWVGVSLEPLGVSSATQKHLRSLRPFLGQQGQDLTVTAQMAAAGRPVGDALAQSLARLWHVPGATQIWPRVLAGLKQRLPERSVLSEAKAKAKMDEKPEQMDGDLMPADEYRDVGQQAAPQPEAEPPRDADSDESETVSTEERTDPDMDADRIPFEGTGPDEDRQPLPPVRTGWSRGQVVLVSILGVAGVSLAIALALALRSRKQPMMIREAEQQG